MTSVRWMLASKLFKVGLRLIYPTASQETLVALETFSAEFAKDAARLPELAPVRKPLSR